MSAVSLRSERLLWLIDEEVFMRLGGDNSGPAEDFSLFEEVLGVLAGVFDLIEIGLSDREWAVHGTKCHCVLSLCVFLACSHLATS